MKAIVGGAGSGKTRKIVELIGEMEVFKRVKIIDGENHPDRFTNWAEELGVDRHEVVVDICHFESFADVIIQVLSDKHSKVIFIDVPLLYSIRDLETLEAIEGFVEKEIYVCVQTNREAGIKEAVVRDWRELIGGVYK